MSRIIDVSLGIGPDLLVWPGDPGIEVLPRRRIDRGDEANVSELHVGTHTGTHVDPPVHFVPGGVGMDRVPVDALMGSAEVADLRGLGGPIPASALEALDLDDGVTRLLLRTDDSDLWRMPWPVDFPSEYTSVSVEAARWAVDRGIRLVGVDFLSIEQRGAPGHPVHHTLLENGVVIVEGLDLGNVEPGRYELVCLPLKILDGDGGPARAVLIAE
jgi:arylformamidase